MSVLGALVLSFAPVNDTNSGLTRAVIIVAALSALLWLSHNRAVDALLRRVIERVLRRYTDFDVRDYAALLHRRGQWRVAQIPVEADDWIASRPVGQLSLPEEGVAVLGVEQADGAWIGAPSEDVQLAVGDVVVLYGRVPILDDIAQRIHGDEGDDAGRRFREWHAASPASEPSTPAQGRKARPQA